MSSSDVVNRRTEDVANSFFQLKLVAPFGTISCKWFSMKILRAIAAVLILVLLASLVLPLVASTIA